MTDYLLRKERLDEGKTLSSERNYTVSAIIHFDDGVNKGNLTVRASSEEEAADVATKKLMSIWNVLDKQIEITKVRKS